MLNVVVLVGRIGNDLEMRYTPSGKANLRISLAVQRDRKVEDNYPTDWFTVVAWGKTAEFLTNYAEKGQLISVDGRLQNRSWVDQGGKKHSVSEVIANKIKLLSRHKTDTSQHADPPAADIPNDDTDYDPFSEE